MCVRNLDMALIFLLKDLYLKKYAIQHYCKPHSVDEVSTTSVYAVKFSPKPVLKFNFTIQRQLNEKETPAAAAFEPAPKTAVPQALGRARRRQYGLNTRNSRILYRTRFGVAGCVRGAPVAGVPDGPVGAPTASSVSSQ
ncbi:hypothetical protein EVAR_98312_1 [Eumeta japonica]|uniref:Uncharacterized protein n=1 Tax=Eumeta variegata TaxID=151549 RepID=A0A4C1X9G4_EUMVA|nr:hypothetical protein EVAR_98312_1 [Eumeta japonica]